MNARITLVGTETHLNEMYNKSIADNWSFDDADIQEKFDKDTLLATIINKGGQFGVLYQDPLYYHQASWYWWNRWERTFEKWIIALYKDYEPLWNTDRYEEVHEDTKDVGTNDTVFGETVDNDSTYQKNGTQHEVSDEDTSNSVTTTFAGTEEGQVSAYDSSEYQPKDKKINNSTQTEVGTGTDDITKDTTVAETGSATDDTKRNSTTDNDTTNDRDFDHDLHAWGNIGVMSSQDLLGQELKIQEWNLYNHIADVFCNEMLIRVY